MNKALRSLAALALLLPSFSSAVPRGSGNGASPETPFLPARSTSSSSSNGTSTSNVDTFPAGLHMAVDYYPEAWTDEPEKKNGDVQRQKDAGLSYIRIGEFMWSTIEPQDGVYNWTLLDSAIDEIGSKGMKVILG
jgi:Beta-galactosidase